MPLRSAVCAFALSLVAFSPRLAGQSAPVVTTLHSFTGVGAEGASPWSGLIQGNDGNFYGTTVNGGSKGDGTVYRVTPAGVLTTLHSFAGRGADGEAPVAALIQGSDGNFYGTTSSGGSSGAGTVFKMTLAGAVTTLHSFAGMLIGPKGVADPQSRHRSA